MTKKTQNQMEERTAAYIDASFIDGIYYDSFAMSEADKGRADYRSPKCGENVMLLLVFAADANVDLTK